MPPPRNSAMATAATQQQRRSHASELTVSGLASGLFSPTHSELLFSDAEEWEPEPGAAGAATNKLLRRDLHRSPRLPPRAAVPSHADASDGEAQRSKNGTTTPFVSALGKLTDRLEVMVVSGRRPQDANERRHSADSGLWATRASGDTTYGKFQILSSDPPSVRTAATYRENSPPPGAALRLGLGLGLGGAEGGAGAACLGLGGTEGIEGAACGEHRPAPGAAGTATKKVTPLRGGGEDSASAVPHLQHTVPQVRRRGSRRSTAAKVGVAPTPQAKGTNKGKAKRQNLRSKRTSLSENPFGAESSGEGVHMEAGAVEPLASKNLRSKRTSLSENPFGAKSSGEGVRMEAGAAKPLASSGVDSPTCLFNERNTEICAPLALQRRMHPSLESTPSFGGQGYGYEDDRDSEEDLSVEYVGGWRRHRHRHRHRRRSTSDFSRDPDADDADRAAAWRDFEAVLEHGYDGNNVVVRTVPMRATWQSGACRLHLSPAYARGVDVGGSTRAAPSVRSFRPMAAPR
eukprot:CAMPEP_0118850916 /NCGR_PEP_ID=MMETSP1163-20130328/555_1 /TAXON_ID=124430 /ORGANISM="Phaeomonas parva, Strain CCMP2877" /LENGTH=516 /DNA_ID=CAMNT_0006783161 /DNA_START=148 /DNA_END=1699 /DNA_ORIENTATION=-